MLSLTSNTRVTRSLSSRLVFRRAIHDNIPSPDIHLYSVGLIYGLFAFLGRLAGLFVSFEDTWNLPVANRISRRWFVPQHLDYRSLCEMMGQHAISWPSLNVSYIILVGSLYSGYVIYLCQCYLLKTFCDNWRLQGSNLMIGINGTSYWVQSLDG